ncbi:ATP-binding cassette domain-containing protein [Rubripirellula sp.]|nr:ATP-binding cassette domain-containing protein [Rubripirellula sp.]MDB4634514.1 ATP-binding cassette domain-containing protein [Rubripirellula sp.]
MIEFQKVCIRAGDFQLKDVTFEIGSGQYAVLMGRTGRGKTTILESLCGLRRIQSGKIMIRGMDVTDWPPGDREIGYVPQDLALFPTFSVAEHLKFALKLRRFHATQIEHRVNELAEMLSITHLLKRQIEGLSGGESQRVALGRALSFRPTVLLLDEPLSALDAETREEIQALLRTLTDNTGVTTLHITHNAAEATALADRRFHIVDGQVTEESVNQTEQNSRSDSPAG